ncbi:hypothetical protein GOV05_04905 [Candidatus Woesearchaeota archaeon]|nr:hypothetical protein [Candidatus Woesearchaeota archaeon]
MIDAKEIIAKTFKIELIINVFVKLSIIGVLIPSIFRGQWLLVFLSSLFLLISFIPTIVQKKFNIFLPAEFGIIISLFLYATFILGELQKYYLKYWWWDIFLHSFSAFILGLIGFTIMYAFHYVEKISISPWLSALFSFNFAIAIGVIWEIFEFVMDQALGLNMQRSGVVDTMTDLIVDSLGALLAAVIGFFYLKGGDSHIVKRIVERFVRINFKNKRRTSNDELF